MVIPIDPEHEKSMTFQSYQEFAKIQGVYTHRLKKHRSLEGDFMEYMRLTAGSLEGVEEPFEVRQISLSWAIPHRINAFHIHPREVQDELWCALSGSMLVWLVDIRKDSPSSAVKQRFLLSSEEPVLLHIPSGVAHGYKSGPEGALLLYTMNSQFDPADPNEARLPWDHFGGELWEQDRG